MNETKEIVDRIGAMASESAAIAIEQYSSWYLTNAIVWLLLGAVMIITSVSLMKKALKFWKKDRCDNGLPAITLVVMLLFGILLIFCNINNIINPEAYAIHQLLKDLSGR